MVSDTTLAGPLRCGLSHASFRVRLPGESGTAVTGEVGREEAEPLSDMEESSGPKLRVSKRHARMSTESGLSDRLQNAVTRRVG